MNRPLTPRLAFALAIILGGVALLLLWGSWAAAMISAVAGLGALLVTAPTATPSAPLDTAESPAPLPGTEEIDTLLDGISEPVLMTARGKVVRANRAARRLLGAHIVGEDVRVAIRHPAAAERLTGGPIEEPLSIELVGLGTRDQRWDMRVAPLACEPEEDRRLIHLIDRTGSHAAERMRVDFVANASHELRTPLAGILGFVETLADPDTGGDAETRERFLKIIEGEARRMQRLVDDLMSLSRIEADKYRLPDAALNLGSLTSEVIGIFRESHGDRGKDVVAELDADLPPVFGDRAQLSQLLHNLIGNACKYGRPGTPIIVRLAAGPAGMLTLSVKDEGEGIAPAHLPRLTERFYRVDSGRSRAMGGTGLGLAIVKHIVERHRGRLDIASSVGVGTTITVALPLAE